MNSFTLLLVVVNVYISVVHFARYSEATNNMTEVMKSVAPFRECLTNKHPAVCVKEKALIAINETMFSDNPLEFYGLEIERNPHFHVNLTDEENLPVEASDRSLKLSDQLHDKIEEFFKSRTIKFNVDSVFEDAAVEGRGKKGGKKGAGMMMMGVFGMACMMAQLMLGKIAFLAGTALIIAKIALFLSAIIGFKKLASGSGGGGETQHVVYASSGGDYGHSHGGGGGGGWHRSIDDAQSLAYKAHIAENSVGY